MGQDASCQRACCSDFSKVRNELNVNNNNLAVHWDQSQDKQYLFSSNNQYERQSSIHNQSDKKAVKGYVMTDLEELEEQSNNFQNDDPSTKSQSSHQIKKNLTTYFGNRDLLSGIKKSGLQITNHLVLTQSQFKRFYSSTQITLTSSSYNNTPTQSQEIIKSVDNFSNNSSNWQWTELQEICDKLFPSNINELYVEKDSNWLGLYLVSGLNAISCQPVYLLRMFETQKKSEDNPDLNFNNTLSKNGETVKETQFFIYILQNGIIRRIQIDNNVPCSANKKESLHISSLSYAFSPLFLKAYSILYGGYTAIQKGIFGQFIRDITWAPYEYIQLKSQEISSIYDYILQNLQKNYIVTLSKYLDNSWTDCVLTLQQEGSTNKVLVKRGQDGSLRWIFFEDLKQMYNFCGVNKCNDEYFYSYITQNLNCKLNKEIFIVQLESSQNVNHTFLTVTQQDKRYYQNQQNNFTYDYIRMILVKGSLNVVNRQINIESWADDHIQIGRDSTIECFLNQGTYLLYVEIEKSSNLQSKICFNSYSQEKIQFQFAENQDLFKCLAQSASLSNLNNNQEILEQRLIEKFLISKTKKLIENRNQIYYYPEDQEISRVNGLAAGNIFFVYENNSSNGSVLREKHRIRKRNDPLFVKEWQIEINPKQKKIVSYTLLRGEDINDIIVDLIYTDISLSEKKILLNIKQIPQSNQVFKEQRTINGIHINAFMQTYTYSGGYSILFENFSKFACTETLYYQIANLQSDDLDQGNKSITFILDPGQSKLFNLRRIDLLKSVEFQLKSTYQFHQ